MVNNSEPKVTFHGEINLDRLAWILGKIKSKHLGYPVKATIRTTTDEEIENQQVKEAIK